MGAPITDEIAFTAGAAYDRGRDGRPDVTSATASVNWAITDEMFASVLGRYRDSGDDRSFDALLTFSWRFSDRGFVNANYDTNTQALRIAASYSQGRGAEAWGVFGGVQVRSSDTSLNGGVAYTGNRIEAVAEHATAYDIDVSRIVSSRTSLQARGSIAYAGGKIAAGRQISDAFAIVSKHPSLGEADAYIDYADRTGDYSARTDGLGPALVSDMSANVPREIKVTVPDAPVGYDLGDGVLPVAPTYRPATRSPSAPSSR